jgi:adenine-specific DNA-methyltransferase
MTVRQERKLRHDTTDAEKLLWKHIRDRQLAGMKFRRQHPIGRYVADFCSEEEKLVIELDGGQHANDTDKDEQRTQYIEKFGYRVVRYWNNEVLSNIEGVLADIRVHAQDIT